MKKIENIDELEDNKYYWLVNKEANRNGWRCRRLEQFISTDGVYPSYFGSKLWVNSAFERFDIYGPIPEPEIDEMK